MNALKKLVSTSLVMIGLFGMASALISPDSGTSSGQETVSASVESLSLTNISLFVTSD